MSAFRMGALAVFASVALAPGMNACDLKTATNNTRAPGYVAGVEKCLSQMPTGFSVDETIERDNIARVNTERQKRGLKPLLLRKDLLSPARWHSMDMAANDYFSHYEKSKRTHADRISLLDRKLIYSVASENIAMIRGNDIAGKEPETLHRGLMESDSHRAAILSDEVTHMATGVIRHENGVWLTQVFVNQMGEFLVPVPTRIQPKQDLRFSVQLPGWSPGGFEARQDDKNKLFTNVRSGAALRLPNGVHGDFQLMVRGERPNRAITSNSDTKEYLLRATASGPIMSVAPESYITASRNRVRRVSVSVSRPVTTQSPKTSSSSAS